MKKSDQTVENMIMQAHYLEALDIESKAQKPLAEMERQDFINTITDLKAMIESLKLTIDTLRQTIISQNAANASLQESMNRLQSAYEQAVKERDDLNNRMNRSNQETFGSKSLKQRNRGKSVKNDRQKERDEWSSKDDNNNGSSDSSSSATSSNGEVDQTKVKSENLSRSGRSGMKYNRMNAAVTVTLETSLEGAPEDMKFVGYKEVEEYTKKSYVECTVFKVAVYEDKYGMRHEYYRPKEKDDNRRPNLNVIPSTHCTPEFLADLVVDHFMLMTPIYRQRVRNILDKLQISRNTNRNWLSHGAEMLAPIVRILKKRLLKVKSILNIDETWTKVRIKFKGDKTQLGRYYKKYVWVLVNKAEQITYFFYDNDENDSRGTRPIQTFLGDFIGSIQSDGYVVYKELAKYNPANEHLMCWAHVRNKFEAVFKACKDADADLFVKLIAILYSIEAECLLNRYTPDQIKKRRNQKDVSKILSLIYKKANEMLSNPKRYHYSEMMRRALVYVTSNWDDLIKYRHDGHYTIDNMLAERSIRPFTVKRKNSLFFSSEDGIKSALTYHTLIETCKNVGLNVKEYFVHVFSKLIEGEKDYEKLLPCAVAL